MRIAYLKIRNLDSNKKLKNLITKSQKKTFVRKFKDLITKSNENSLLKDKKSRLSLEKSYFLLDRRGCNDNNHNTNHGNNNNTNNNNDN